MIYKFHGEKPIAGNQMAELFESLEWASARFPDRLSGILENCTILGAWEGEKLVGLMSALSDSFNVYFQYLCVHPDFQRQGVGSELIRLILEKYHDHPRQVLTTVPEALDFYLRMGFHVREGKVSLAARDI